MVAGLAAQTAAVPPPAAKAPFMARIDAEGHSRAALSQVMPSARLAPPRRSVWTIVSAGVMAAGIVAIGVGLAVSTVYDRRISQLGQQQAQLNELRSRLERLERLLDSPARGD